MKTVTAALRADGMPYRQRETDLTRALSAAPKGVVPAVPDPAAVAPAKGRRR